MGDNEIFLVDSNSFMTPFRFYYAFDLVPAYWKELNKHINSGRIVVLDIVKDEIDKGNDDLAKWIADLDQLTVVPKVTEKRWDVIKKSCGMLQSVVCIKNLLYIHGLRVMLPIRGLLHLPKQMDIQ